MKATLGSNVMSGCGFDLIKLIFKPNIRFKHGFHNAGLSPGQTTATRGKVDLRLCSELRLRNHGFFKEGY